MSSRSRANATQVEILISTMKKHPKMVQGKLSKDFSLSKRQRLWTRLVDQLNSIEGGAQKTESKWRKTWSDMKQAVKEKVRKLQAQYSDSLTNSETTLALGCKELSPVEEKVYALLLSLEGKSTLPNYSPPSESPPPLKKLLPKIAPKVSTSSINLSPDTYIVVNTQPKESQVNSVIIMPEIKPCKIDASQQTDIRMSMMKSKKNLSATPYVGALIRVKEQAVRARKEHAAAQFEMAEAHKELAAVYREVAMAQQELAESQNNLRCSFDKLTQLALKVAQRFV